ncbi:uracil-DNA glycosylase [Dehalococcoides mccartyi]|nr:uracil-DNA glycosylase [Dehalococcoides mccartyi]
MEELAAAVQTCTKCALHSGRTNAVPGSGSAKGGILIIGEGPGFNEDQQGLPFVGRSGKLLDELLAEIPLSREDVFITNVVKCRPPENRDPLPDEVTACRPYLERQLELLDPKVIVTLGRHSMLRFYPKGKISVDHGKILEWEGRILFPLYHPAAGLRNPAIKRELQKDVLRLPEALKQAALISSEHSENESDQEIQEENKEQENIRSHDQLAEAQEQNEAEAQLFEPLLKNETNEKEKGDRQLGMF